MDQDLFAGRTSSGRPALLVLGHNVSLRRTGVLLGCPPVTCAIPEVWSAAGLTALPGEQVVWVEDLTSVEGVLSALHGSGRTDDIVGVVTNNETAVVLAATVGRLLGAAAVDLDTAVLSRSKPLQKRRYAAAGVPTAAVLGTWPTAELADAARRWWADGPERAVVLKPVAGAGTHHTALVRDLDGVRAYLAALTGPEAPGKVLVEEAVTDHDELHVDGVVHDGRLELLSVGRYVHPCLATAQGHPLGTVLFDPRRNADLYARVTPLCAAALAALGLRTGCFHLELFRRRSSGELLVNECAVRGAGWYFVSNVTRKFGTDLVALGAARLIAGDRSPLAHPGGPSQPVLTDAVAGTHLPFLPGVVVSSPRTEDLLAQPGVVAGAVGAEPGDTTSDLRLSSDAGNGHAELVGPDESAVLDRIDEIVDWYARRTVLDCPDGGRRTLYEEAARLGLAFAGGGRTVSASR